MKAKWFNTFLVLVMLVIAIVPVASAAPPPPLRPLPDDPSFPPTATMLRIRLVTVQREAKEVAVEAELHGKSDGDDNDHTHKVGLKHYVELDRLGEDSRFGPCWSIRSHNQHPSLSRWFARPSA